MPAKSRQITPEAGAFVPAQGTVALHRSVARPVFGVIPDVWTSSHSGGRLPRWSIRTKVRLTEFGIATFRSIALEGLIAWQRPQVRVLWQGQHGSRNLPRLAKVISRYQPSHQPKCKTAHP